jgi:hypothetical protein
MLRNDRLIGRLCAVSVITGFFLLNVFSGLGLTDGVASRMV